MKFKYCILCLLIILIVNHHSIAQSKLSPIWGDLEKGNYNVGFKILYEFDYSRVYHGPQSVTGKTFPGETARPIRIGVWYPVAKTTSGKRMQYKDYINLQPTDKKFFDYNKSLCDYDYWATVNWTNLTDSSKNKILNIQVEAIKDAKAAAGKFPLIVHYLGLNDRRNENIPLWEYLVSQGYVVVSIPQVSGGGDVYMELGLGSTLSKETQVRDMEFAVSQLRIFKFIDFSNIGVIGYSYGSVFAMRMAMFNPYIKAIATFDGNVNNKNGQSVIESFYNPKINAAWLNIYREKYENEDLKIFETLKYTNRYRITYTNAIHGDFEDFAIATSLMPEQTPAYALKERPVSTAKRNYETTCRLTLEFFNTFIKKIPASGNKLETIISEEKLAGIITDFEYRKASKVMDEEDLANAIIYYGIDEAEKIYNTVTADNDYEVFVAPSDLLIVATALRMGGRRILKSNDVLFFMERNFPADKKVYMELGRNFIELNKLAEAKKYLLKVLDTDKENKEAIELMKKIK
ncbi:MAG: dienelactone hydrolase family protein [Saprospiraceae bacterium]